MYEPSRPARVGPRGPGSPRGCEHGWTVRVRIDRVLAAAFESGDFEPLAELYAADALLDWSMPGRRARVVGPEAIVQQLGAWWPGSGVFTRWDVSTFQSGLTIEFERRAGGALRRQRQFVQVRDGRIVRHQAYCARPQGGEMEELPDDAPVAAERRLTREESRRLLATFAAMHVGFAGERIEGACSIEDRIVIAAPATVAEEVDGVDYLPKILAVGWEVFAETVPADVATAVLGAVENPQPLARELARCARTLIHNDLRGANLGLLSDRTIVLDWGMAGSGPCELDFAWYLFVN